MNNNQVRNGAYNNNGATGAPGLGGSVYQHFSAPSSTFINVFNQPGDYNVTMRFAPAAGRVNPSDGAGGAAGALNRQVPMIVDSQAGEQRGVPMIPRPTAQIRVPNPLSPRSAFAVAPERLQMTKDPFKTPDRQTTMYRPAPPPKPTKFDISVDPRATMP